MKFLYNYTVIIKYRIILSAFLEAIKFNEDSSYSYSHYTCVFGLSSSELSILELSFLELIDYNLFVSDTLYNECWSYLKKKIKQ